MKTLMFNGWKCILQESAYADNDRVALELVEFGTSEPVAMATVNLPDTVLKDNEIILKDWSENEGMAKALYVYGIVGPPLRMVSTGFVLATVVELFNYKEADEISVEDLIAASEKYDTLIKLEV